MLFDIHAHLNYKTFDKDRDEVVKRSEEAGVVAVIDNGTDVGSNRKVLELSKRYRIVLPALGIYPSEALMMSDEEIDEELEFISKQKIVAIGEVGLDFFKVPNHARQEAVFLKFIELAKKMDLPMIVHSRDAEERTFELLQQGGVKRVVMHCFSGNLELAEKIEKAGYFFSIPPAIVVSKKFQKLAKKISVEKLFTETDSPFLSHIPRTRNEPKNVEVTLKKISEIKKLEFFEVKKIFFMNFRRFFQIETFL
ncbi:MAG: TatD family hydrolase [archaeon]